MYPGIVSREMGQKMTLRESHLLREIGQDALTLRREMRSGAEEARAEELRPCKAWGTWRKNRRRKRKKHVALSKNSQ